MKQRSIKKRSFEIFLKVPSFYRDPREIFRKIRLQIPPTYGIPAFIGIGWADPEEPKLGQNKPDLDKQIRFGRWK